MQRVAKWLVKRNAQAIDGERVDALGPGLLCCGFLASSFGGK